MYIWIYDEYKQYPEEWDDDDQYIKLPPTTRETSYVITSYVNEARNENGAVIGQVVGRANVKMDNLEWKMIDYDTISMILNLVKPKRNDSDVNNRNFFFNMRIPNLFSDHEFYELTAYSGDATIKPYWLTSSGQNIKVGDLKVNLIDCGILDLIGDPNNASS